MLARVWGRDGKRFVFMGICGWEWAIRWKCRSTSGWLFLAVGSSLKRVGRRAGRWLVS